MPEILVLNHIRLFAERHGCRRHRAERHGWGRHRVERPLSQHGPLIDEFADERAAVARAGLAHRSPSLPGDERHAGANDQDRDEKTAGQLRTRGS